MKTNPLALLGGICGFVLVASAPVVIAIPQQVGAIGVLAGLPLEEYLREDKNWGAGVLVPGETNSEVAASEGSKRSVTQVERPISVLGQMAESLSLSRAADGSLLQVDVSYSGGAGASRLVERLRQTGAAWAGKDGKVIDGSVFAYGLKVSVAQVKGSQTVMVRFVKVGG